MDKLLLNTMFNEIEMKALYVKMPFGFGGGPVDSALTLYYDDTSSSATETTFRALKNL